MTMENPPKITVVHPDKEIVDATKLIDRFLKKNNIKIKYSVEINSKLSDAYGIFDPNDGNHTKITINPSLLINDPPTKPFSKRYSYDRTLHSVCVHEFAHMIDNKYNLIEDYKKKFKDKIILNHNSTSNRYEELVETLVLYLTNPYLLRHINKDVYLYWSSFYHSPTRVSKSAFIKAWSEWSVEVKADCIKRWKIRATKTKVFLL